MGAHRAVSALELLDDALLILAQLGVRGLEAGRLLLTFGLFGLALGLFGLPGAFSPKGRSSPWSGCALPSPRERLTKGLRCGSGPSA